MRNIASLKQKIDMRDIPHSYVCWRMSARWTDYLSNVFCLPPYSKNFIHHFEEAVITVCEEWDNHLLNTQDFQGFIDSFSSYHDLTLAPVPLDIDLDLSYYTNTDTHEQN